MARNENIGRKRHMGAHKYQRLRWKSAKSREPYYIYKCMIPGCTHYVPRDLVIGNETICWKCNKTIIMDSQMTYLAKPHCKKCTASKKSQVSLEEVESNLDKLLNGGL